MDQQIVINILTKEEVEKYNCDCSYKGKWLYLPVQWFTRYTEKCCFIDKELIFCPNCGRVRLVKIQ